MALDTNTLELIRRTVFGGPQGGVLDFNAAFNPAGAAASMNFDQMMGALMPSGGDPGTNAGVNATGLDSQSAAGINAIGGLTGAAVANAVPGVSAAMTAISAMMGITNPISAMNNIATLSAALGLTSISTAPQSAEAAAQSQADSDPATNGSVGDSTGGDSGGAASASPGDGGGAGGVGGGGDGYSSGGFVPGHDLTGKDNIPVRLSGGEVVIPTHIVDMLGHNFFEDLLLNTKSPAQEFAENQAADAAKAAAQAAKSNKGN